MQRPTYKTLFTLFFILLLALSSGCNNKSGDEAILREQARLMLIAEAQQGFHEVFNKNFDPQKTQMLVGPDLKRALDEKKTITSRLPQEVQKALAKADIGLLINDALPGKKGGTVGVIYMRPGVFGGVRRFLSLDNDPCGDGNPATCERCTSCSGETSPGGTISTCVCTQSCDACRPCPTC
jgi:hypothetical protein